MAEKTEEATPKKLRDARAKGQLAKSQDVPSAATFIGSFALVLILGDYLAERLSSIIYTHFMAIRQRHLLRASEWFILYGLQKMLVLSLPIICFSSLIGVLTHFFMVGPLFTLDPLKLDFKKLDPIQGIKNKLTLKTFFEVGKSLLKIGIATYLIYGVIKDNLEAIRASVRFSYLDTIKIYYHFLYEVMKRVGLLFIFVAIVDFFFQKRQFLNSMKMEKHEIKQEYKNTEGDPQIKGKRKELAREIATGDAPQRNVKRAKALVTNPTHIAVAIDYAPEKGFFTPIIIAMGRGNNAFLIMAEAKKWEIPIVQNALLARQLLRGKLYEFIPEETYEAIAEILRWVASLKREGKVLS